MGDIVSALLSAARYSLSKQRKECHSESSGSSLGFTRPRQFVSSFWSEENAEIHWATFHYIPSLGKAKIFLRLRMRMPACCNDFRSLCLTSSPDFKFMPALPFRVILVGKIIDELARGAGGSFSISSTGGKTIIAFEERDRQTEREQS